MDNDIENAIALNKEPILGKVEAILNTWKHRALTLIGKIEIVNSLIASLLVYRCSVLPQLPGKYLVRLNDLIQKFIWNEKRPKIKLEVLMGLKEFGGLGLVDIRNRDQALKAQWIVKILHETKLKELAYLILENQMGDQIWEAQLVM